MGKLTFIYKKEDGTEKIREIFNPTFVKEPVNKFPLMENGNVNYILGYELDNSLNEEQKTVYKDLIEEYFEDFPTLDEFLRKMGADPKKVNFKTFKKRNIKQIL